MKVYILISLFLLSVLPGTSQVVAIQNNMNNGLMLCMDNYLTVAVEGLASGDILLSTNNGSIKPDEYNGAGRYIYYANTPGVATIYVKKRNKKRVEKVVDSVRFYVRRMPILPPTFAGKSTGSLNHFVILAQLGIIVPGDVHADIRFPVNNYSISVYRNNKEIFRREIDGPKFDKTTNDFFYTLNNNDRLKFESIQIKDCDGELRTAEPIEIIVKDAIEYEKIKGADTIYVEDPITGEIIQNRRDSIWKQTGKYK